MKEEQGFVWEVWG